MLSSTHFITLEEEMENIMVSPPPSTMIGILQPHNITMCNHIWMYVVCKLWRENNIEVENGIFTVLMLNFVFE